MGQIWNEKMGWNSNSMAFLNAIGITLTENGYRVKSINYPV
jgi:hypothetical protein